MEARTEAQKVLQLPLTVVVGGRPMPVRPLTMAESDAWVKDSLVAQIVATWGKVDTITGWEDAVNQLGSAPGQAMLTCIVEYDADGLLGGREQLYKTATPGEIWEALKVLARSAFPFVQDATKWAPSFVSLIMAEVAKVSRVPATSMPLRSVPGVVSPRKSTRR